MKRSLLCGLLAAGTAAAFLPASAAPPAAGVTIDLDQDLYSVDDHVFLTITGVPGTIVVLGFDFDPGPTVLPGIGTVDLGFSKSFQFAVLPPIPAEGFFTVEWHCNEVCPAPLAGRDLFIQGIAIDPVTFALSTTNSQVLNIEDLEGECPSTGCTPGYWKNHPETWGPTGLSPDDSFDAVFGVDAYDPDITLMEALDPTNPLGVFSTHAVAALLNSLHPGEDYAISSDEVIHQVQEAIASGNAEQMEEVKDLLAHLNEIGCPF